MKIIVLGDADNITPPAFDRMTGWIVRRATFCDGKVHSLPGDQGFARVEGLGLVRHDGCYRLKGHTGRHLGITTTADPVRKGRISRHIDYWVVWP